MRAAEIEIDSENPGAASCNIQVGDSANTLGQPTGEHQNKFHVDQEVRGFLAERLLRRSVWVRRVVLLLAALEQGATYLGQIAFLGATVVLLGGYVSRLKLYDFKLISGLLLSEGVRVFLASQSVEYLVASGFHRGTWGGIITWSMWASRLCQRQFRSRHTGGAKSLSIHMMFDALQMGSAAVTFGFSLSRLNSGDYKPTLSSGSSSDPEGEVANFVYGMRLFYILTLVESAVYLVVKLLAWDCLLCWLVFTSKGDIESYILGAHFGPQVYEVFMKEGFSKASAINLLAHVTNRILKHGGDAHHYNFALGLLSWELPQEAGTFEIIKCLIQLTAPGAYEETRRIANNFLARIVLRGTSVTLRNFLLAVQEFGRIPLEVVDIEVIEFLDCIVTKAPLGFLPPEAVSKQASEYLIKSIVEGRDDKIKAQSALKFLNWWSDPNVYQRYVLDPADIFYRLFIHRRHWSIVGIRRNHVDYSKLEAVFGYEPVAGPIRTIFSNQVEPLRSGIMNKFLSKVDFSKLKNKRSTIDLSGIIPEIIGAESELHDTVVRLVAAWIWFMDESTFQKAISNLTKEELDMLKKNTDIYEAILLSEKEEWFQNNNMT